MPEAGGGDSVQGRQRQIRQIPTNAGQRLNGRPYVSCRAVNVGSRRSCSVAGHVCIDRRVRMYRSPLAYVQVVTHVCPDGRVDLAVGMGFEV